jgi:hypothetical protein
MKIRHLQSQIVSVFFFTPGLRQVLDKNGGFYDRISFSQVTGA